MIENSILGAINTCVLIYLYFQPLKFAADISGQSVIERGIECTLRIYQTLILATN